MAAERLAVEEDIGAVVDRAEVQEGAPPGVRAASKRRWYQTRP